MMCLRILTQKNCVQKDNITKHIEYFDEHTKAIKKIYYLIHKEEQSLLHGEYKEYRQNGILWVHCWYNCDQLVNTYKQYDINGNIWYEYSYKY